MCSASADASEFSRVGPLSRWRYYVGSIPTLLTRIRPPLPGLAAFLGSPGRRPFPLAVAADPGRLYMATKAGLAERSRTLPQEEGSAAAPIEAITLEQVFDRSRIERCDFLKIDCEGAEYDILFGASEVALRRI